MDGKAGRFSFASPTLAFKPFLPPPLLPLHARSPRDTHVVALLGGPYHGCIVFTGGATSLVCTAVADSCLQLYGSPAGGCGLRRRMDGDGRWTT